MKSDAEVASARTETMGRAGFHISLWALIACVAVSGYTIAMESEKVDPATLAPDQSMRVVGNWMASAVQVVVFIGGGLVGGTLAIVGMCLSSRGLGYGDDRLAKFGFGLGLLSLILLGFVPMLCS